MLEIWKLKRKIIHCLTESEILGEKEVRVVRWLLAMGLRRKNH